MDKKEVPVHVLEKMVVHLQDGEIVTIDIKQIIADGADPDEIELHINRRLKELDAYIYNVDFFVDIDQVQKTVQPITDRLLSKL